jgi:DNA repair protein RadA/Sms
MATKPKTIYVCANCGHNSPRWQGKCPECGEWNTFQEQSAPTSSRVSGNTRPGQVQSLSEVKTGAVERISSGMAELDEVLGGGIVPGSLILLGGDPGIGKSTLALQMAINLNPNSSQKNFMKMAGTQCMHGVR